MRYPDGETAAEIRGQKAALTLRAKRLAEYIAYNEQRVRDLRARAPRGSRLRADELFRDQYACVLRHLRRLRHRSRETLALRAHLDTLGRGAMSDD